VLVSGNAYGFVNELVEVFNLALSFWVSGSNSVMLESGIFSEFSKRLGVEWWSIVTLEGFGNTVGGENLL
jgi:hypothetical protein